MEVPEILSVREFRAGLAGVLRQVGEAGSGPVFVGAHRKPEVVVMSVEQYERLQAAATRRAAVADALASVRAEGLEPSPEGLARFAAVSEGRMSPEEAIEQALAPYHR